MKKLLEFVIFACLFAVVAQTVSIFDFNIKTESDETRIKKIALNELRRNLSIPSSLVLCDEYGEDAGMNSMVINIIPASDSNITTYYGYITMTHTGKHEYKVTDRKFVECNYSGLDSIAYEKWHRPTIYEVKFYAKVKNVFGVVVKNDYVVYVSAKGDATCYADKDSFIEKKRTVTTDKSILGSIKLKKPNRYM